MNENKLEQEDSLSWRSGRTPRDLVQDFFAEGEESADLYLKESWLVSTISMLRDARLAAGLTQQELAERLGTTQSAVARLERESDTKLSTLWNYLAACGVAPASIETMALNKLREYVSADSAAPRTSAAVRMWQEWRTPHTFESAGYTWETPTWTMRVESPLVSTQSAQAKSREHNSLLNFPQAA